MDKWGILLNFAVGMEWDGSAFGCASCVGGFYGLAHGLMVAIGWFLGLNFEFINFEITEYVEK